MSEKDSGTIPAAAGGERATGDQRAEDAAEIERLKVQIDGMVKGQAVMWKALTESVDLQTHYAALLNLHDGGTRRTFADANEWMSRLFYLWEQQSKRAKRRKAKATGATPDRSDSTPSQTAR